MVSPSATQNARFTIPSFTLQANHLTQLKKRDVSQSKKSVTVKNNNSLFESYTSDLFHIFSGEKRTN
jgi:hypothetical protein